MNVYAGWWARCLKKQQRGGLESNRLIMEIDREVFCMHKEVYLDSG